MLHSVWDTRKAVCTFFNDGGWFTGRARPELLGLAFSGFIINCAIRKRMPASRHQDLFLRRSRRSAPPADPTK